MALYGYCFPIFVGMWHGALAAKHLGFDTFDDVIDHSYETELDPAKRTLLALELNRDILIDHRPRKQDYLKRHKNNFDIVTNNLQSQTNNQSVSDVNNQYHEELLKNQEIEKIDSLSTEDNEMPFSQETSEPLEKIEEDQNGLREFGVDTNEPDLFSSENNNLDSNDLLNSSEDEKEDDDLEIPAFLRRQKN